MRKILLFSLLCGIVLVFAGCGPPFGPGEDTPPARGIDPNIDPDTGQAPPNLPEEQSDWQTYTNTKHNYSLQYPKDWFFVKDACCPPVPTFVNFNSVADTRAGLGKAQGEGRGSKSIDILCLYEADVNQAGEVQAQIDDGERNELFEVNGFTGIRFTKQAGPGSNFNVLTHYISNPGVESCRIIFLDVCKDCENILRTFRYSVN